MLLISTAQLWWTDGWSRAGKWRPHWTHDRLHKQQQRHVRTQGVAGRSSSMAGNRKNSWISCPLDIPSALHHHNNIIASSSVECVNPIVCLSPLMSDKQQLFRLCNQIAPPTTLVSTNWPPDSLECVHYSHHCIPLSYSKGFNYNLIPCYGGSHYTIKEKSYCPRALLLLSRGVLWLCHEWLKFFAR